MADVEININRLTEIHRSLERARINLSNCRAPNFKTKSYSPALEAFSERVKELEALVDKYCLRLEQDSKALYQAASTYMDLDSSLANTYRSMIGSSILKNLSKE